jgi:septal ring factor EnvC (AmiA/AmiB activator)
VAVGAGELEEAETKQLAETKKELVKVSAALRDVNEENETLKRRIAALEGRDSYA